MFARSLILCGIVLLAACTSLAPPKHIAPPIGTQSSQHAFLAACEPFDDWDKPAPPFRIYGNSYYVGTCGLSAILVAGDDGHILIDGAARGGGPLIAASIKRLGFEPGDVKLLMLSHEHFDHAGGLAYIQRVSGAKMVSSKGAAETLRTGKAQPGDPQYGSLDPFEPVDVSRTVRDGEMVSLGKLTLTAMETPGHTPGALTWSWWSCQRTDCKVLVYADSLSPISSDGYRFSDHPEYVAMFRAGLSRLAATPCDLLLTPHPSSSAMLKRMASAEGLVDNAACARYADEIEARLGKRLADEQPSP